jgi:hypothetical protein
MEAPKCRHCDKRHWERVCPSLAAKLPIPATEKPAQRTPAPEPQKAGFDRNAYQRAYMRAWRKAKKARDLAKPV